MIERDIKLARLEISRVSRRSSRVDLEIIRLILGDEVQKCTAEVWKESVVLFLNGIREDVIFLKEMAIVDVERGELVFAHSVNLLDVHEFSVCDFGKITIGSRGGCKCHFFSESELRC